MINTCLDFDTQCNHENTGSCERCEVTSLFLLHVFARILQSPQLLSDSCLHLFLQSDLSVSRIEACAAGRTHFSVAQAVHRCGLRRFHSEEDLHKDVSMCCDSDLDRYSTV